MNPDNKYFLPAAVILAGVLIAGAVIWNGSRPAGSGTPSGTPPVVDIKNVDIEGDPFIGAANAPVTIAFWSDFQCPYCKAVEVGHEQIPVEPAIPEVIKNYVDTGKVKLVFMDFVFLGQDSLTAALYSRAIWKLYPNKYFEWRTKMYESQDEEGDQGFGDAASIDKLNATIAGIDAKKVTDDVKANTDAYQAAINADRTEGQKVGVDATPSFVIGKQLLKGAQPYSYLQAAIDEALK